MKIRQRNWQSSSEWGVRNGYAAVVTFVEAVSRNLAANPRLMNRCLVAWLMRSAGFISAMMCTLYSRSFIRCIRRITMYFYDSRYVRDIIHMFLRNPKTIILSRSAERNYSKTHQEWNNVETRRFLVSTIVQYHNAYVTLLNSSCAYPSPSA